MKGDILNPDTTAESVGTARRELREAREKIDFLEWENKKLRENISDLERKREERDLDKMATEFFTIIGVFAFIATLVGLGGVCHSIGTADLTEGYGWGCFTLFSGVFAAASALVISRLNPRKKTT